MNNVELGKRIREIRLSRHMTQSDVAGNFITRNMLSQIENGTACPSIKTLEHISKVLNIPLEQLISVDTGNQSLSEISANTAASKSVQELTSDEYIYILSSAKRNYRCACFEEITNLLSNVCEKNSPIYDEANALLARACFELAKQSRHDGNLTQAAEFGNLAVKYAGNGIYASDELMMKAYRLTLDK